MRPEDIKLEGDEWYVPLTQNLPDRPELVSAAYLLKALHDSAHVARFDLIPGGFYLDSTAEIILPLPVWGDLSNANMLNSVTRLVTRIKSLRGFANKVTLLAVSADGTQVSDDSKNALRTAYLLVAKLPSDADIAVVGIADI